METVVRASRSPPAALAPQRLLSLCWANGLQAGQGWASSARKAGLPLGYLAPALRSPWQDVLGAGAGAECFDGGAGGLLPPLPGGSCLEGTGGRVWLQLLQPCVRAPLFPALMERRLMQHECLPVPFTPLSSLVRLQLSWDPKSVFSPTSAMFIFLGTSCNTGELGAYKSGQEV